MKELLEYMDSINADGIDFVEISFPINDKIIASYTNLEQLKEENDDSLLEVRRIQK